MVAVFVKVLFLVALILDRVSCASTNYLSAAGDPVRRVWLTVGLSTWVVNDCICIVWRRWLSCGVRTTPLIDNTSLSSSMCSSSCSLWFVSHGRALLPVFRYVVGGSIYVIVADVVGVHDGGLAVYSSSRSISCFRGVCPC